MKSEKATQILLLAAGLADPKKLQQINEINDIKIPCEEISDQLFCNGKATKPFPKDPPGEKQSYDAIGGKNFHKL